MHTDREDGSLQTGTLSSAARPSSLVSVCSVTLGTLGRLPPLTRSLAKSQITGSAMSIVTPDRSATTGPGTGEAFQDYCFLKFIFS